MVPVPNPIQMYRYVTHSPGESAGLGMKGASGLSYSAVTDLQFSAPFYTIHRPCFDGGKSSLRSGESLCRRIYQRNFKEN